MEKLQITNSPHTELLIHRHLVQGLTKELVDRGMSITIAEGASGGGLIDAITIPGSTKIIHIGGVFYSLEAKVHQLGVSKNTIEQHGEYSNEVAMEMAINMLRGSGASLSIATVGQLEASKSDGSKYVSVAYVMKGRTPWVKRVVLAKETANRRLIKNEITQTAFSHALYYVRNNYGLFLRDQSAFQYRGEAPISYELNATHDVAEKLIKGLRVGGLRLATMESCTAGSIANAITDIPGSSEVFDYGWLAYDENIKAKLGVPLAAMTNGNVYSLKVARAMAEALLRRSGVDVVITTTGTLETMDIRP
ncbi:CinA family protein, partial [Candidatus Gottesmanbacteria bacterium]|nr:CinA family protein [Candidatus Gottesmanbacteria bacterium]